MPRRPAGDGSASIGVDTGTTATRVSILPNSAKGDPVQVPFTVTRDGSPPGADRYPDCDHPSIAYPFQIYDSPKDCIGFPAAHKPYPFPLKICVYLFLYEQLENEDLESRAKMRKDLPQLDSFLTHRDAQPDIRQAVTAHLEAIFIHHLTAVQTRTNNVAAAKGLHITRLAATIPANWDKEMQQIYLGLLQKVWSNLEDDSIQLLYESEAVGHWLLRLNATAFSRGKSERLIIVDFGGHTLNTAYFAIVRQDQVEGERFVFFTYAETDCQHGGSEMHTSKTKAKIDTFIAERNLTEHEREYLYKELMDCYRGRERSTINGRKFYLQGKKAEGVKEDLITIEFHRNTTHSMYKTAFETPLKHLYRRLQQNAKLPGRTDVVLYGGSFKNTGVERQTTETIKRAGLGNTTWISTLRPANGESSIISQGAALAIVNSMTVSEFIDEAAFAVDYTDNDSEHLEIIHNGRGGRGVYVEFSDDEEDNHLWVVCAPLGPGLRDEHVLRKNTFEFQPIGSNFKGKYMVHMEYEKLSDEVGQLVVRLYKGTFRNQIPRQVRWLIHYDCGACIFVVNEDELENRAEDAFVVEPSSPTKRSKRSTKGLKARRRNKSGRKEVHREDLDVVDSAEECDGPDCVEYVGSNPSEATASNDASTAGPSTAGTVSPGITVPGTTTTGTTTTGTTTTGTIYTGTTVGITTAGTLAPGTTAPIATTVGATTPSQNTTGNTTVGKPATGSTTVGSSTARKPGTGKTPDHATASGSKAATHPKAADTTAKGTKAAKKMTPSGSKTALPKSTQEVTGSKVGKSTASLPKTSSTTTSNATPNTISSMPITSREPPQPIPTRPSRPTSPIRPVNPTRACINVRTESPPAGPSFSIPEMRIMENPGGKSAGSSNCTRSSAVPRTSPRVNTTNLPRARHVRFDGLPDDDSPLPTINPTKLSDEVPFEKVVSDIPRGNVVVVNAIDGSGGQSSAMLIAQLSLAGLKRPAEAGISPPSSRLALDRPDRPDQQQRSQHQHVIHPAPRPTPSNPPGRALYATMDPPPA